MVGIYIRAGSTDKPARFKSDDLVMAGDIMIAETESDDVTKFWVNVANWIRLMNG